MTATQTQTVAPVVLAAVSIEAAKASAKGMVKAAVTREKADATFLASVVEAAKLVGVPLSAKQYDKQVGPYVRDAFKASKLADTSKASYASRFKTLTLAVLSGHVPVAGQGYVAFLTSAAEFVAHAKLENGQPIWEAGAKRGAKAKGASPAKPSKGTSSAAVVQDSEGGFNGTPAKAAALILTTGNETRAAKLVIVMQSYPEQFDKWTATIMSEADKKELAALTATPKAA